MRTVIITGGTGGLGAAVTARFVDEGWRAVVPWRRRSEAERVPRREGLELIEADLFDPGAVARVAELAGPGTRAVVNLAGGFHAGGRVHDSQIEDLRGQLRLNLETAWIATAAALPAMLAAGDGAVVCVSSRSALQPFAGGSAYAVSKAAVLALVDALHTEYAKDGIRANAILPSVIDTPANRAAHPDADHSDWVAPEQIAATILALCGPQMAATSGAHVPVYGRA